MPILHAHVAHESSVEMSALTRLSVIAPQRITMRPQPRTEPLSYSCPSVEVMPSCDILLSSLRCGQLQADQGAMWQTSGGNC